MLEQQGNRLIYRFDAETLFIEPWGNNALRVRSTREAEMPPEDWALARPPETAATITIDNGAADITNGKLRAHIDKTGKLRFYNQANALLLEEFVRDMSQRDFTSHMRISSRDLRGLPGGEFQACLRFESDPDEKLYGMGQYQQGILNLKGAQLELMQRNSQVTVPFVLSSKGYGMLWNNPAVGDVSFATNITQWRAHNTNCIDYWITAGDSPSEIVENYVINTGLPPMMPESAMGFWQCRLRYRTQEELLSVAREYVRRGLPISVIVIDFFHWTKHGDWKFDARAWPDPDGMVKELKAMGIDVAVSVWPTVQLDSENFREMLIKGYLVQTDTGVRLCMRASEWAVFFDATNPEACRYVFDKIKANYLASGIKYLWLDCAEPQYASQFNNGPEAYRYKIGPHMRVGNAYPDFLLKGIHTGQTAMGDDKPLSLVRSAWAGSQKYGALVWSGDVHSSFKSMRWQLCAGLNCGLAGISWWTTDIGGFDCGNIEDEAFRELLARWFQWGAFCPVMRLHGDRQPHKLAGESGLNDYSGADNEVWSFGDKKYPILCKYLRLREAMRPYIRRVMREAHTTGAPVMRPLFYHYPDDPAAWDIKESYLFGRDVLVAPVMQAGVDTISVYLPKGDDWIEWATDTQYAGGQWIQAHAPIDVIPVFTRKGARVEGLTHTGGTER